jgi:uncharacterized ion transporter superfamily protein YfcC
MWYANRIQKKPTKIIRVWHNGRRQSLLSLGEKQEEYRFTGRRIATLVVFLGTFVVMVVYMVAWDEILSTDAMEKAGNWMNENVPYITGSIPGFRNGWFNWSCTILPDFRFNYRSH